MSTGTDHAAHLFEAYFCRDCLLDDPEWESVVLRFRQCEHLEVVRTAHAELVELLTLADDPQLEEFLFGRAQLCFYDPRPEGLSLRAWLEEIVRLLAGGSPRTSGRIAVSRARRDAATIASSVLAGTADPILASRELSALRHDVGVGENDPDFMCVVAIDSETDALPIGPERNQWSAEALSGLDHEIADARRRALTLGRSAFENIVRRFGGHKAWRENF